MTGQTGGEKKNLMIISEYLNKIYPFFTSISIVAAGIILVFFGLSKREGLKIFGIALTAVSIIAAIVLNIWSFKIYGDFSDNLFTYNLFAAAAATIILFAALNILVYISVINFHNDNFIKIILVFLAAIFFFTVFISANNFIMIFTSFAVLLLAVFQLSSVLSSRGSKGNFSEYSIKNSIIRFYLAAAFSFLLTFMGYSLIYGSADFKFFGQLLESDKMSGPLVIAGLFIILASLYIFMFLFPLQSAYIKMQNRTQYSGMQVVWFFYFPAGILMFFKLKGVLYYFLDKHSIGVTGALLAISAVCILGGNIGAISTQGIRRIMSFLYLSMTGMILLGFAQFGLGMISNSKAVWLAVANIVFMALIYFPFGLFSSELENKFGSDRITNMAGYLRTQKYIGINLLILLLAFGGLIGTTGYVLRFMYLQPFLAGFNKLLSAGTDIGFSVLNISSFAVMLISWVFIAANMIRLIYCLAKIPPLGKASYAATASSGQNQETAFGQGPAAASAPAQNQATWPAQNQEIWPGQNQETESAQNQATEPAQNQAIVSGQNQSTASTQNQATESAQNQAAEPAWDQLISRQKDAGRFRFSWFLYSYLTFFSIIVVLSGIMGLLEILGVNLSFLNFSLINFNF